MIMIATRMVPGHTLDVPVGRGHSMMWTLVSEVTPARYWVRVFDNLVSASATPHNQHWQDVVITHRTAHSRIPLYHFTPLLRVTLANMLMNRISSETIDSIGYIFVADCVSIHSAWRGYLKKLTEVAKMRKRRVTSCSRSFKVHQICRQSKGNMLLPISGWWQPRPYPAQSGSYGDSLVKKSPNTESHCFNALAWGDGLRIRLWAIYCKQLESTEYLSVKTALSYVHLFWHNTDVWRTDAQTELLHSIQRWAHSCVL